MEAKSVERKAQSEMEKRKPETRVQKPENQSSGYWLLVSGFFICLVLLNGCAKKPAETWTEEGICMMETGDFDGALKPLNKAIELSPKLPKAHYAMAVAYVRKNNPDTALARKHYEIALKLGYRVPDWFLPYLERLEKR